MVVCGAALKKDLRNTYNFRVRFFLSTIAVLSTFIIFLLKFSTSPLVLGYTRVTGLLSNPINLGLLLYSFEIKIHYQIVLSMEYKTL